MKKIYLNGCIYTENEEDDIVSAIVTDDEKILFAGNRDSAIKHANESSEIIDLDGRVVLPGFIDSHIHPGMCSKSAWHVRLPWTENVGEVLDFVARYAEEHPVSETPFLYFEYYPTSMFDENGPRKEMLDAVVSDRPVLCQDFGEHLCWMNSKMLELMEVDKSTPDPSSLETFVRDEDGTPTGWVREFAWLHFADKMFNKLGWKPPEELTVKQMEPFFKFIEDSGITAIFDAFIESDEQIRSIYEMDLANELHVYYDGSVRFWRYNDLPEKIAKLREYSKLYTTEHIKINTMKLFLDGTNESGNSASDRKSVV